MAEEVGVGQLLSITPKAAVLLGRSCEEGCQEGGGGLVLNDVAILLIQ